MCFFFFFKQKTAYEMRISDWSSDVCSSDLGSSCWVVWNIGGYSSGRVDAVDDELDDAASAVSVIGGQHGVDAALELGRAGEAAHELLEDVLAVAQFFEDASVDGGVDGRLGRHALRGHLRTGRLRDRKSVGVGKEGS